MVTFTINIPQMLAYIPYMDPMGYGFKLHWHMSWKNESRVNWDHNGNLFINESTKVQKNGLNPSAFLESSKQPIQQPIQASMIRVSQESWFLSSDFFYGSPLVIAAYGWWPWNLPMEGAWRIHRRNSEKTVASPFYVAEKSGFLFNRKLLDE